MRKEFEENEEKLKESENNLEMQDDIDDETFRKILEEEFIEREKQIEEALFADKDFEDFVPTDEEVQASYEELMRRFEREKKESTEFSGELVPDEKLVHELALKEKLTDAAEDENAADVAVDENIYSDEKKKVLFLDELRERRKKKSVSTDEHEKPDSKSTEIRKKSMGGRRYRLGRVVGMAAVAVACVFAASMTSEANRTYLVNSVRIWSGDGSKTIVDNSETNEKSGNNEEKAISNIKTELKVNMPKFYYRPYGFEFSNYAIDKLATLAWVEYEYKNQKVVLMIDKENVKVASRINSLDGDEDNDIILDNDGISIRIKKIYDVEEDKFNYVAEWYDDETLYLLSGRIELEEIKKILENMRF